MAKVSLKRHLAELRKADLRAVALAFENVRRQREEDRETDKAWRASQNEWRGESKDRSETYLTRGEFEQSQRNLSSDKVSAGTSLRGVVAIGLTVLGLVITTVVIAANAFFGR